MKLSRRNLFKTAIAAVVVSALPIKSAAEEFKLPDMRNWTPPVGSIYPYDGRFKIPEGYLEPIGQTLEAKDYPELYNVLKDSYPRGQEWLQEEGKIKVPDLRYTIDGDPRSLVDRGKIDVHIKYIMKF